MRALFRPSEVEVRVGLNKVNGRVGESCLLHGIARGLMGDLVGHHLKARKARPVRFDGASRYDANM